ncbi:EscU/YscU/HrcU family type III secretion system export apparatus switch protein, partial [Arthrospira platensis SPKY1]|nr:EscU/YscU/HrcU family type III secretion system export apparatus switch protein [Arthrospira platensis SPKY1]
MLLGLAPLGFERLRTTLQAQMRFDQATLAHPEQMVERLLGAATEGLLLAIPLGLLVLAVAVFSMLVSGSWALSTKPITPELSRLSLFKGFERLFSRQQLVETFKLTGITAIVGVVA